MQKTKKILILSTSYLPMVGGSEIAIKEITDRLSEIEFDLVTSHFLKNTLSEEKMGNINVFRVGGGLGLFNFLLPKNFLPIAVFKKARELIKNRGPYDLVHIFQASQAGGAVWLLKFFYPKLKILLTLQEGQDLEKQNFLKRFFRSLIIKKINRATAISEYLKKYMLGIRKDLPVYVAPNGVDMDVFLKDFSYGELSDLAEKLEIKPGEKIIITTGRLVYKNGVDTLIKAMAILAKHPDNKFKLLIIGEGEQKNELLSLAEKLGLKSKVVFAGSVENRELPKYLKIAHIFVRPSRSEGLGNSFLEAMAAGIPIIGPAVGGIVDFLKDGQTGLICDQNNPEDIAKKIELIMEDENLRKKLVSNAKLLVEQKYNWDKIAQDYQNQYDIINSNSSL